MNDSLKALLHDAVSSLRDLAPIVVVFSIFQLLIVRQPVDGFLTLVSGGILVVAGLAFFIFGLRLALFPVGEGLAVSLADKGSAFWLLTFAFLLGFGTTIAEPALIAVAAEAAEVAASSNVIASTDEAKSDYAGELRLIVAFAVAFALVIGVIRILFDWSLAAMIIGGYVLAIVMTGIAPPEIVGVAYDSGGVTTSTVTVPLVTALGVGLAGSLRGRNPMSDGFGLIAFASLTPIIFVLAHGIITSWI